MTAGDGTATPSPSWLAARASAGPSGPVDDSLVDGLIDRAASADDDTADDDTADDDTADDDTADDDTADDDTADDDTADDDTAYGGAAGVGAVPAEQVPHDPSTGLEEDAPATGEEPVDAALAGLRELSTLPVGEHPAVYDAVHRELARVLAQAAGGSAATPTRS